MQRNHVMRAKFNIKQKGCQNFALKEWKGNLSKSNALSEGNCLTPYGAKEDKRLVYRNVQKIIILNKIRMCCRKISIKDWFINGVNLKTVYLQKACFSFDRSDNYMSWKLDHSTNNHLFEFYRVCRPFWWCTYA